MGVEIIEGDSREVLKEFADNSIDSCVTDPPYALTSGKKGGSGVKSDNPNSPAGRARITTGFMGKAWDTGETAFDPAFWFEVLRVLKPGGHVLAFGGTRTYHRLACAIEDAGFEIRDQIGWVYGSGFPKSSNQHGDWEGWGTALKPAWEPIVVARKELDGTVPQNLARWGLGALNIDGCRVPSGADHADKCASVVGIASDRNVNTYGSMQGAGEDSYSPLGRWPANLIHDGSDEVLAQFPQCKTGGPGVTKKNNNSPVYSGPASSADRVTVGYTDDGSAARFFYCAKASKADRDDGVTGPEKPVVTFATANGTSGKASSISEGRETAYRNTHPTVKPTTLMQYLCRLVTPPGGMALDPFMGSGSTGRGAVLEGFSFTGIEMTPEYFDLADQRIAAAEARAPSKLQAVA